MMVVAHTLKRLGDTTRKLYLYDTFAGMSPPTGKDIRCDGMERIGWVQNKPLMSISNTASSNRFYSAWAMTAGSQ